MSYTLGSAVVFTVSFCDTALLKAERDGEYERECQCAGLDGVKITRGLPIKQAFSCWLLLSLFL